MNRKFSPFEKIKTLEYTNVSVVFLFNKHQEVLLQHRDDKINIVHPNIWGPLGGHCNLNETPYECAIREMKEETDYICKDLYWDDNYVLPYKDKKEYLVNKDKKKYLVSVFWDMYDGVQKIKCLEGQSIEFISLSNLEKYNILSHSLIMINKIIEILKVKELYFFE